MCANIQAKNLSVVLFIGQEEKFYWKMAGVNFLRIYLFELFLGFFISFFLGSFFLGNIPSNTQSGSRCEPQPSISDMLTDEEVKLNCKIQKSPPVLYTAALFDVKLASPFNSPVQLFFLSK